MFEISGGEGGIRTLETIARLTVFKTVAFDRSGIPPIYGSKTQARAYSIQRTESTYFFAKATFTPSAINNPPSVLLKIP